MASSVNQTVRLPRRRNAAQAAYTDLQAHAAALQALRDHLTASSSPKDVQDAQAQIEFEQVWTANEAAQLTAINAAYAAQRNAMVQRDNEKLSMDIDNFGNVFSNSDSIKKAWLCFAYSIMFLSTSLVPPLAPVALGI